MTSPQESRLESDHRCLCGQLLARLTPGGVQIKCRRCKRVQIVPWDTDGFKFK